MNYRFNTVAAALFCLAGIWSLALYDASQSQETALQKSRAETLVEARAYAEYSKASIKRLNEVLLHYREHWFDTGASFSKRVESTQREIADLAFQVAVLDQNGVLQYSSIAGAKLGIDLSDRPHFKAHKDAPTQDVLYISSPVKGRVSGKWSIQFTRSLRKDGQFRGVIVASVDPEVFSEFGRSLKIGERGSVSMLRNNGELLNRFPNYEAYLGKVYVEAPFLNAAVPPSANYERVAATDQVRKIFGYYKDPEFGLIFLVGQSKDEVLALSMEHRRMVFWLAAFGSLLVVLLFTLLWRAFERSERLAQSLLNAKLRAEEANVAKSQFLANMSHEIRTPMNGVIGMTQLLLESPLSPQQQEFARMIEASGDSLLHLINDILDLSKIEAGHMEFESKPFDLNAMLAHTARLMQLRAAQKGIDFVWTSSVETDQLHVGDSLRIGQVLMNLLGNALKFTARGEVRLNVTATASLVRFAVTDTGIGIPKASMARLFSSFMQVDASTSRKFGGTGLGLVICKRLVEGMGGTIGVDSEEGRGSTFWFELPLSTVPLSDPAPGMEPPAFEAIAETVTATAPVALPVQTGSRILLVEDHPINQRLATVLLEKLGCTCELAQNGQEGVDAARNHRYDLIFMDLQMPVMDGLQATRLIREGGLNVTTPIVAMTANVMPSDRDACLAVGMNDFISKPFNKAALTAIVEKWAAVDHAAPLHDMVSLERARTIIEDTQDAIISKTLTGIITSWNRGAERIFGYTAREAIGMPMLLVIPPDRKHEEDEFLRRVGNGEHIDSFETVRQKKSGELIDVSVTLSPMRDASGAIMGVSKIARDISDRKAAEQLLLEKERAELAAQARTNLMMSMSHELRTPLHHIVGFSDVLLGSDISSEQQQQALAIKDAVQLLIGQLGNILDSVEMSQGELQLQIGDFAIAGVLREIEQAYAGQAAARGLHWSVQCDANVPVHLSGDAPKLTALLRHLVDNAFKFTAVGNIGLTVKRVDGLMEFRIADTGCGMTPQQVQQIFKPLTQLDQALSRIHGGIGMGCALVDQLARLMDGTVQVESEPGQGSVFTVRIPAHEPQRRLQILAVDDVPLNLTLLKAILGKQHALTCVESGAKALELFKQHRFDVVLMDLQMPALDGLQTTRLIRAMEAQSQGRPTPIIAVTANTSSLDRSNAFEAGMNDFVTKPINRSDLLQRIRKVCQPL